MRLGDGEKVIAYVETRPSALDTSKLREKSSGKNKETDMWVAKANIQYCCCRCGAHSKHLPIHCLLGAKGDCLPPSTSGLCKEHHGKQRGTIEAFVREGWTIKGDGGITKADWHTAKEQLYPGRRG